MNNCNGKKIDIIFSVLNAFLEYQSSGTLKVKDCKAIYVNSIWEEEKQSA